MKKYLDRLANWWLNRRCLACPGDLKNWATTSDGSLVFITSKNEIAKFGPNGKCAWTHSVGDLEEKHGPSIYDTTFEDSAARIAADEER